MPELSIGVGATPRGRGIETMLIQRLLQEAGETGIERVSLRVERPTP